MNWSKALISGVVGGVAMIAYEFVVHGMIMAKTYQSYALFRQDTNPIWYPILALLLGVVAGLIFERTRGSWSAGPKGGMNFGLWLGLIFFVAGFGYPLMFQGFPYYLS